MVDLFTPHRKLKCIPSYNSAAGYWFPDTGFCLKPYSALHFYNTIKAKVKHKNPSFQSRRLMLNIVCS